MESWRAKKNSEIKKDLSPSKNTSIVENEPIEETAEKKDESLKCSTKDTDIVLEEELRNPIEESSKSSTEDKPIDEEEEWIPPEFVSCIKFLMDEFKDAIVAEAKIRSILKENNIKIKKLRILHGTQYQFRKLFGIEIEDYRYDTLEALKETIRKKQEGVALEIKYNRTIDTIDKYVFP